MSTPTIGELARRIADLEARGEEWDEEIGMADGADSDPYEGDVKVAGNRAEDFDPQKHFIRLEPVSYEDHEFDLSTHTFNCGGYAHEGELVAHVGGLEAFRDGDGDYWLTSPNIRSGLQKGYLLGRNPDNLRLLADKLEEADR